jgi:uncharacterized protein (TIGR03435 family)
LLSGLLLATAAASQPAAAPSFEVASVKPAAAAEPYHWEMSPGHLRIRSINLQQCVVTAYQVHDFQVSGGPAWAAWDRYDIDGNAAGPADRDELLLMLRTLLAERFHVVLQTRARQVDGYAMLLAKGGLKIQPDTSEGKPAIQVTQDSMIVSRFPMPALAAAVASVLGIPVSDATDLPGSFSFAMKWARQENRMAASSAEAPDTAPPITAALTLGDALEQTVGLKLERRKVPIQALTIEHAEKPSEN